MSGKTKLKDVAKMFAISREAVRQSFIKYVGKNNYKLYRLNKKKKAMEERLNKKYPQNFKDAICFLKHRLNVENNKKYYELFITALKIINSKIDIEIIRYDIKKNHIILTAQNNKKIIVRIVKPQEDSVDSVKGFYRFHIIDSVLKYQFAIFIILCNSNNCIYIFNTRKISHLKTLSLNFTNDFVSNKYLSAKDHWSLFL